MLPDQQKNGKARTMENVDSVEALELSQERPTWHPQKNSSSIPRNWYFADFSASDYPQRAAAEMFKKETSLGPNRCE